MRTISLTVLFIVSLSLVTMADSWTPPKIKDYYNLDKTFFVRIVPRTIPKKFWKWKEAKPVQKKRFNPTDTTIIPCHAIMYKRTKNGDSLVWRRNLVNEVNPVSAFVSNDGSYLVTFDNWHSVGYGVDVMVYYDKLGDLVKKHMLEDLSPFPVDTYSGSISSRWWRCDSKFLDNKRIEICFRDENGAEKKIIYNLFETKIE
jgi:hypothetical protein